MDSPTHTISQSNNGFTIVELLIVIVVIGILAAITIVAYNGIQGRAQVAAVASALEQVSKKLALYSIDNNAYPIDLATAGIANSGGTSYQYSANNGVTPQTYCVTGTNGATSYLISSTTTTPTSGGCAGHGVGGVAAVTNIVLNPSFEGGLYNWFNAMKNGDTATTSSVHSNTGSQALVLTVASSSIDSYYETYIPLQPGTWTVSGYVYLPNNGPTFGNRDFLIFNSSGLSGTPGAITYNHSLIGQWQRVSTTFTSVTAGTLGVRFYGPVGVTYADSVMVTPGATLFQYADGYSSNWVWNGTANASTSAGPAL